MNRFYVLAVDQVIKIHLFLIYKNFDSSAIFFSSVIVNTSYKFQIQIILCKTDIDLGLGWVKH